MAHISFTGFHCCVSAENVKGKWLANLLLT